MQNTQPELSLKRIKIMIAMKKGVSRGQTESCNKAIDGFADRMPPATEQAIILRGRDSQIDSSGIEYLESAQFPPKPVEG